MNLRIKLWLGKMFGWDKAGLRAAVILACFWVVVIGGLWAYDNILFPEPACDAQCEAVTELLRDLANTTPEPIDADKLIREMLND